MNEDNSILKDVRKSVVGTEDNKEFDDDLLPHINSSIAKLNQNGIGNFISVQDETTKWKDLKNTDQEAGNKYFQSVPHYLIVSTKLLFDPPPPSVVEFHANSAKEMLWRLKIAYEDSES